MMKYTYTLLSLLFICSLSTAQNGATRTHFEIELQSMVNMSELPDDPWMTELINLEAKDFFGNPDKSFLYAQKRKSSELYPRKKVTTMQPKSTMAVNPPVLNTNFPANTSNGSVPLDNYLAVSDSFKIVSVSNTKIQTYDTGGAVIQLRTLNNFTNSLGLFGSANSKYDPKVIYDPIADRFITVILNGFTSTYSKIIVGFSQTNDPEGNWNLYTLPGNPFNDTTWFDYPALNITDNELFITGNQIRDNESWQLGFRQTVIWQVKKKEGYEGNTLVTDVWSNVEYGGKRIRNLHPVKWGPAISGPNQYFLSNRNFDIENDTIFLLEVTDTIGAAGTQLNVDVIIADKKYGVPPSVPQPNTNQYLSTNDGRVLTGMYRNGQIQFASNSIDTSNGRAAIYWGLIDGVDNQTYTLQSSLIKNDTLEFGYPNLSWVGDGATTSQTIITFEHCSEVRYAGLSGLFYADNEFSDIITIKEGEGTLNALTDSIERWGDYSGSQPVFNRAGKMWMCGMYANSFNAYATWVAQLDNPFGAETSVEENPGLNLNTQIFPNPSEHFVNIKFDLPHFVADFRINVVDINGKNLGILYQGDAGKGVNNLAFQTDHLSPGVYFIQLWDGDNVLQSLKFIRK